MLFQLIAGLLLRRRVAEIEGDELLRAFGDRLPHRVLVVGVERHPVSGPAAGDVHLFGVGRTERGGRHGEDRLIDRLTLAGKAGIDIPHAEMTGILADQPAIVEPDVAALGDGCNLMCRTVTERVLAVTGFHRVPCD